MYAGVHKTLALNNNCVYVTNYVLPPSINSKLHSSSRCSSCCPDLYRLTLLHREEGGGESTRLAVNRVKPLLTVWTICFLALIVFTIGENEDYRKKSIGSYLKSTGRSFNTMIHLLPPKHKHPLTLTVGGLRLGLGLDNRVNGGYLTDTPTPVSIVSPYLGHW